MKEKETKRIKKVSNQERKKERNKEKNEKLELKETRGRERENAERKKNIKEWNIMKKNERYTMENSYPCNLSLLNWERCVFHYHAGGLTLYESLSSLRKKKKKKDDRNSLFFEYIFIPGKTEIIYFCFFTFCKYIIIPKKIKIAIIYFSHFMSTFPCLGNDDSEHLLCCYLTREKIWVEVEGLYLWFSAFFYYLLLFYTFFCFQAVNGLCCPHSLESSKFL